MLDRQELGREELRSMRQRLERLVETTDVGQDDAEVVAGGRVLDGVARLVVTGNPLLQLCDRVEHVPILPDMRIIVAGVGNVLRGDDGFGVAVADRLLEQKPPTEVEILDVGIGGIHLVQELLAGADALVVVDAVDLGRAPGTVVVQRPEIREIEGPDDLASVHYATPERALMFARGLEILPASVWLVGCQVVDAESIGHGLSAKLAGAVEAAAAEVRRLVTGLGVPWI